MPFVNIRTAKGLLTTERKRELSSRITDLLVEVEGRGNPAFRSYVLVLIEEHDADAWAAAGQQLTPAAIDALIGAAGS